MQMELQKDQTFFLHNRCQCQCHWEKEKGERHDESIMPHARAFFAQNQIGSKARRYHFIRYTTGTPLTPYTDNAPPGFAAPSGKDCYLHADSVVLS
jgi:hypothetical protein